MGIQGLTSNHFNGIKGSRNMKQVLKTLNEVHDIPLTKRYPGRSTFTNEGKCLDFAKIENHFGKKVSDTANTFTSGIVQDYLEDISGGKVTNMEEFGGEIASALDKGFLKPLTSELKKDTTERVEAFETEDIHGDKDFVFYRYRYSNATSIRIKRYTEFSMTHKEGNTFTMTVTASIAITMNNVRYSSGGISANVSRYTVEETFTKTIDVPFPDYIYTIYTLFTTKDWMVIKFSDGSTTMVTQATKKFYSNFEKTIEFAANIPVKGYSYDEKTSEKLKLVRSKIGYQEHPGKKRNRQNKILESIAGNDKIKQATVSMYLDLYPFKDPKVRKDRGWQQMLRAVMQYFAGITGISGNSGRGLLSLRISDSQSLNINIQKEVISTKPNEVCYFSTKDNDTKVKARVKGIWGHYNRWVGLDRHIILNYVSKGDGDNYVKYSLDYTYFYQGLRQAPYSTDGSNLPFGVDLEETLMYYINAGIEVAALKNKDPEVLKEYGWVENPSTGEWSPPSDPDPNTEEDSPSALSNVNSFSAAASGLEQEDLGFWSDMNDRTAGAIQFEGAGEGAAYTTLHPRLPMPTKLWRMFSYKAKQVSYGSTVLMWNYVHYTYKKKGGWMKVLSIVLIVVAVVISIVSFGSLSFSIGFAAAFAATAFTVAGGVVSVIGILTENTLLSRIGGAMMAIGGITGGVASLAEQGVSLSLSSVGQVAAITSGLVSIGTTIMEMNWERKIERAANEARGEQEAWERELDSRIDMEGGIKKTSNGGDEDFDIFYSMMDIEMLLRVIESSIDVAATSFVFNDTKYDNTRLA
jgi:hypothetical protein